MITSYYRRMYLAPLEDQARLANCTHSFMALYGVKLLHLYSDGRIKAQTAAGHYLDLQCLWRGDSWTANPMKWTAQLRALDSLPALTYNGSTIPDA